MEEKLVSINTAILAKEVGFNLNTLKVWFDSYSYPENSLHIKAKLTYREDLDETQNNFIEYSYPAPTQSLLQKWLREVHKLQIDIDFCANEDYYGYAFFVIQIGYHEDIDKNYLTNDTRTTLHGIDSETYEDCLEKGLLFCLNYLKSKTTTQND